MLRLATSETSREIIGAGARGFSLDTSAARLMVGIKQKRRRQGRDHTVTVALGRRKEVCEHRGPFYVRLPRCRVPQDVGTSPDPAADLPGISAS